MAGRMLGLDERAEEKIVWENGDARDGISTALQTDNQTVTLTCCESPVAGSSSSEAKSCKGSCLDLPCSGVYG